MSVIDLQTPLEPFQATNQPVADADDFFEIIFQYLQKHAVTQNDWISTQVVNETYNEMNLLFTQDEYRVKLKERIINLIQKFMPYPGQNDKKIFGILKTLIENRGILGDEFSGLDDFLPGERSGEV